MAELATVASIVGISDTGIRGIQSAFKFLEAIKHAPKRVAGIRSELVSLQDVLRSIPSDAEGRLQVQSTAERLDLAKIVDDCGAACTTFQDKLGHWMPNPAEATAWDRVLVGAHRGTLLEFKRTLRETKETVIMATSVATLRLQVVALERQGMDSNARALVETEQARIHQSVRDVARLEGEDEEDEEQEEADESEDAAVEPLFERSQLDDIHEQFRKASAKAFMLAGFVGTDQRLGSIDAGHSNNVQAGAPRETVRVLRKQELGHISVGDHNTVRHGIW